MDIKRTKIEDLNNQNFRSPIYWLAQGYEQLFVDYIFNEAINQIIVPIQDIFLPDNVVDAVYVSNLSRIYFITSDNISTIQSQEFPNLNNARGVPEIVRRAKRKKDESKYERKSIDDFKLLKLFASSSTLYVFASSYKNNQSSQYLILQIPVNNEIGFLGDNILIKTVSGLPEYLSKNIKIEHIQISVEKSIIILHDIEIGTLYYGFFNKIISNTVHFNDLLMELKILNFRCSSFTIGGIDEKYYTIYLLNKDDSLIKMLNISLKEKPKVLFKKEIVLKIKEIWNFEFFKIRSDNLRYKLSKNVLFEFLLCIKFETLYSIDLVKGNCWKLIGGGNVQIGPKAEINNMLVYKLDPIDFLLTINEHLFIFGNTNSKKLYAWISPSVRKYYFETNKIFSGPKEYETT